MTKILNHINTYADLTAYNADQTKDYPNVSYIQGTDEVKYGTDPRVVCIYNITDTSAATKLLNNTRNISDMIIDGVQQPSVVTSYQFSTTGEHIVKFGLTNNTIVGGTTYNNSAVFNNCTSLIKTTIPNSVTSIGHSVFSDNTNLTKFNSFVNGELIIPNTVTHIYNYAFQNCSGLTSVIIPSSVTTIDTYAFDGCSGLTNVTVERTIPPTMIANDRVFTDSVCPIYVPAESVDAYKAASGWSNYASQIQAIPTT